MKSRLPLVSDSIAVVRIIVRRVQALFCKREIEQGRDALARFEGEGGATARRPAPTSGVHNSRSDDKF